MFRFPRLTPVVRACLVTLLVAYVALVVAVNWLAMPLQGLLALNMHGGFRVDNLWQIFTYLFAQDTQPAGVLPFLVGLVFFWWMVAPIEERFGGKRTLQLLLLSTLAGSLPALAVGLFLDGTLIGFSPLLLGALAAGAWIAKISNADVSFFGVAKMTPMQMILLVLGVSLLIFLTSRNFLELTADLGATAGGILFIESLSTPPKKKKTKKSRKAVDRGGLRVIDGGQSDGPKWLN